MAETINKGGLGSKETHRLPPEAWPRQNSPIADNLAVKRVYQKEPIDETCWAWMKLLREKDPTKRVYPVDPYVEVYQFRENMYGILTISLDGAGDSWIYLIDGPEKAMIIDTSFGLGDLKGLCEEITGGKPLIVVNTHNHFDHAYGNAQFDEVFCHEYEAPVIARQDEHIWDYLFEPDTGRPIWAEFPREALIPWKPYKVTGVPDGYTWDLGGGYEIELISSHGHGGSGAAMYLDKRNRILFPGDNICSDVSGCGNVSYPIEGCNLYRYRECVKKLVARMDEYDSVFPMHFMVDLENRLMPAILETLDAILADPVKNYDWAQTRPSPDGKGTRTRYFKYIPGFSSIAYSIEKEDKEPAPAAITALTKKF